MFRLYNAKSICRRLSTTVINNSSSSSNGNEFRHSEDLAKERYDKRVNEDIQTKRARLLYQSRKRGMLENGVILASFANKYLKNLDANELDEYDRLINLPTNDWDIYYWATKTKPTPEEFETPIMTKLREHLHCKVSNDKTTSDYIEQLKNRYKVRDEYHGKTMPNEIIMQRSRTRVDLEPDFGEISTVDYKDQLFDDRIMKKAGGKYIARMTKWRRDQFLRRLRRTIPSPVSVRNMIDDDKRLIYGQTLKKIDIGFKKLEAADLCDTDYTKNMKHHQFMQHLFTSKFTNDVLDYDDEASAWAEMIWHRNYGHSDPTIDISSLDYTCKSCNEKLHCSDPGVEGYLPKEILAKLKLQLESQQISENIDLKCQRCRFLGIYETSLSLDVESNEFIDIIRHISTIPNSVAIILVDLTDFPSGIYEKLIDLLGSNYFQKIVIVGNKIDILPYDGPGMIRRVTESLRMNLTKLRPSDRNLHLNDIIVISAKTGFNILGLVAKLSKFTEDSMNIFLVGTANSGKSTLFNSLLQSDLSLIREGDLLSRVSSYKITDNPDEARHMLRFPMRTFEGWEISLRERKYERVERNYRQIEKSFLSTTKCRQNEMPHQSMLINRLEFPPAIPDSDNHLLASTEESDLIVKDEQEAMTRTNIERPKFSEDHPLKQISYAKPLTIQEQQQSSQLDPTGFFHLTPSVSTPDQLHDLLTIEEKLIVFPNQTIIPRKYTLRPLQTIFIAGLGRLDLLTATEFIIVTIFASKYLPIHIVESRRADQFYHTFIGTPYLGVPFGTEERLTRWPNRLDSNMVDYLIKSDSWFHGQADIVLSSLGWIMVNLNPDQECILRAYTPEARGIYKRTPCLLPYIRTKLQQKKIRDTPLFKTNTYTNSQLSMDTEIGSTYQLIDDTLYMRHRK